MTTLTAEAKASLKSYLERIERLEEERKSLGDDIREVYAGAKADGFDTKALRALVKARKKEAAEREQEETLLHSYMHAVGMASETPLFSAVGAMGVDTMAREQVIEAFKLLVPPSGEIICKVGGNPIRLWRDDKGVAHAEDHVDAPPRNERVGRSEKPTSATVLSIVPKDGDDVKRAADAAERRTKRKRAEDEPPPMSVGAGESTDEPGDET